MLLLLGGEEVPFMGGETMPIMVVAADPLMVAAMEDKVVVTDVVMGEAMAMEAFPLDVQTTPRQKFSMLESVREYLPISCFEWDLVVQWHASFHLDKERNGDQLKKINKLAKVKMGTGDPNIPSGVSEAKAIHKLIIEKAEGVTGSVEE
jgi:hypothetical protein